MPLTVITVKSVPLSLRGDLSKWMQEIATGVYIGNFNSKIREKLWQRVKDTIGKGEATLSYSCRGELGYNFDTINSDRFVVELDGVPLVFLPNEEYGQISKEILGFSDAARNRRCQKYSSKISNNHSFVVLDIETDGLDENDNVIIELGAVKISLGQRKEFNCFIEYHGSLPSNITKLTGISDVMLRENGISIREGLEKLCDFIGELPIVGYRVDFDMRFINHNLKKLGMNEISNKTIDLVKIVKEQKTLSNYKLQSAVNAYGIEKLIPHRALQDANIIMELAFKLIKFLEF